MVNQKIKKFKIYNKFIIGFFLFLNDLVFLSVSLFLAYYLRFYTSAFGLSEISYSIQEGYIYLSIIYMMVFIVLAFISKVYFIDYIYKSPRHYISIIILTIAASLLLFIYGWVFNQYLFSRIWLILVIVLSAASILLSRMMLGFIIKAVSMKLQFAEDIIVGPKECILSIRNETRSRKKFYYGSFLVISDALCLAIAFYLSYYLRFYTGEMAVIRESFYIDSNYIYYSAIFIVSALLIFFFHRLYNWDYIFRGSGSYTRIFRSLLYNIIVIILVGYGIELLVFSRIWILLLFVISFVLIGLSRFLIEILTHKVLKNLDLASRTLIVGIGENARRIEDSLKKYSFEGHKIIGHVDTRERVLDNKNLSSQFTVIGYLEDIKNIIEKNNIQKIIISGTEYKYFDLLDILEKLKGIDVCILIFPGFFEFSLKRMSMREIGGVPLMQVANIGFFGFNLFLKNAIDYILGIIIFLFFIPIYLIIGLLIKIDSRGPVFFEQKRYTKDCKVFYMYKFRTMYTDAEQRLEELREYNEADGPIFKIKNDPRITRVGRFLRKFSIDELPQIINVLKGELSLVGPRPPIPEEVEKYEEWQKKRLNVKQGITGLWQISGRSELSFEEMSRLDLYYIQNWSIEMDIKILLKTIPVALFGKGAY